MSDPFLVDLILKMVTTAVIVVMASLIVERSGPFLGAMIATLPISAGPSYVFLAYEHGPAFVERSSLMSLATNASTAIFIALYATLAQGRGVLESVGGALAGWLTTAWVITQIEWSLSGAVAFNAVAYAGAILSTRGYLRMPVQSTSRHTPWWAMPVRVTGVMGLVGVVITTGRLVGPTAAGVAALAPVVMTSLATVLHPRIGGASTAAVLTNALFGMVGVAVALVVLHTSIVPLGSAAALSASLAVCVLWNVSLTICRSQLAGWGQRKICSQ